MYDHINLCFSISVGVTTSSLFEIQNNSSHVVGSNTSLCIWGKNLIEQSLDDHRHGLVSGVLTFIVFIYLVAAFCVFYTVPDSITG